MSGGHLQAFLFLLNRPEPIRQSSLLMVLATGLGDTTSLISGLQSLANESRPPWSGRIGQLRMLLEQGQTLSEALSTATGLLPEDTVVAIRVAEETGTLKQVLAEEAHRLMNRPGTSNPVQASLPATLAWIACIGLLTMCMVTFIMVFIIPKFMKIFEDFGTDLPDLTMMLISFSDWFISYWYFVAFPFVTFVGLPAWWMFKWHLEYLSTGRFHFTEHFPRFQTPLILRLLSITVASGSALTDGIHSIMKEMRPGRASELLSGVRQKISAGGDCWEAMCQNGFLKRREVAFLEAATRTHNLDWALLHLARTIERRRGWWAQRIAALCQPLVVLFVGFIVGFVCIALFLPLIKLVGDLA